MGRGVGALGLRLQYRWLPMKLKLFLLVTSLLFCGTSSFSSSPEQQSVLELQLPREPAVRLEQVYLHEFTVTIMKTARHYAFIAGRVPDLDIESLQKFDRCQALFTSLQRRQEELHSITEDDRIDRAAYFEHLLILSLALTHMNRRLYELGKERTELQKDFMRSVTGKGKVNARLKTLDDKIAVLDRKMDSIFAADPANMLLTVGVGHNKRPLYQKIVADYYHLLSMEVTGARLIETIQESNQPLLDGAWEKVTTGNRKFLHQAWRHTCGERKLRGLLRPHKLAALGFYIKHRGLVARVESLLTEQKEDTLLGLQRDAESYFAKRITPEHFHSSASSFFGLLAALTLPAFLVPSKYNKFTVPAMGVAGALYSGYRTKALYDMRTQLETGALSGLNSYDLYHDFRHNTSLIRTAFSHFSVTALAVVLRRMPKEQKKLENVNTKLLLTVGTVGSLFSMFVAETAQTGNINLLKDRDFLYNMLIVVAIDFTLIYLSSPALALSYENRVALTAAASVLLSVTGHVISGKKISWDRIIFDTTYVSTYSLLKAKYFYTNGTHWLTEKLNKSGTSRVGAETAIASAMALLSNFAGNVPYSYIARHWVERQSTYNKFPLPDGQRGDELGNIDLEQEIDRLLAKHNLEDAELKKVLQKWLLDK